MSRETLSSLLLAACVAFVLGGLATLVPHDNSMVSDLGYHTWCPFAPWSTVTLLFLAWVAWAVRGYARTQAK
jgi:hypothetical protein